MKFKTEFWVGTFIGLALAIIIFFIASDLRFSYTGNYDDLSSSQVIAVVSNKGELILEHDIKTDSIKYSFRDSHSQFYGLKGSLEGIVEFLRYSSFAIAPIMMLISFSVWRK